MKTIMVFSITFFLISLSIVNGQSGEAGPVHILYVTGGNPHDYVAQEALLSQELSERLDLEWTANFEAGTDREHKITMFQDPDWHDDYDVVIYNMCFAGVTDVDYIESITTAHYQSGTAAVLIHCAMHTFRDTETDSWDLMVGLETYHHEREQREFHITPVTGDHPVMSDFPSEGWISPRDELYIITKTHEHLIPLAHAYGPETEEYHIVKWANTFGNARIVGTNAGHNDEVLKDPVFIDFLKNGILWAVERN